MTKPDPQELEERRAALAPVLAALREMTSTTKAERVEAFKLFYDELADDDDRYHGFITAIDGIKMTMSTISSEGPEQFSKMSGIEAYRKISAMLALMCTEMESMYIEHHLGVGAVVGAPDDGGDGLDGWTPPDWPDDDDAD